MNARLIAIAAAVLIAYSAAIAASSYFRGKANGREDYHQEQVKKTNEIKRKHAKVKREAPGDSDKPAAIEWLLQRTRK